MADNISLHLRITGLTPSNDDVNACRATVSDLSTAWSKVKTTPQIVAKAASIAESLGGSGIPSDEFGIEIQTFMQKHASAFLYVEKPLDVGICAGMAAVALMSSEPGKHGWTIVDIYTNALWSALAFQPVLQEEKRENLRREVLDRAQKRSLESAENARDRDDVVEPLDLIVTIAEESNKATTNFRKAALGTIESLRRNAALDREEIDFLWWSQTNQSRVLNRPLARISEPTRLVASGVEGSRYLRRFPAEVHRDLVVRNADEDPILDLSELLADIADDRVSLAKGVESSYATDYPSVFPLLNAIITGEINCEGATEKRRASTWGARALLESALSRMMDRLPSK